MVGRAGSPPCRHCGVLVFLCRGVRLSGKGLEREPVHPVLLEAQVLNVVVM